MNCKINMSLISKILNDFMKDTFAYDYTINNIKINENLKNDYRVSLGIKLNEYSEYLTENKIISLVKDIEINSITFTDGIIDLEYSFLLEVENYTANLKEYNCQITLKPIRDKYEIDNIVIFNKIGELYYGFSLVDLLKNRIRIAKPSGNNITLAMTIRNEADKFLKRMLTHAMQYVSNIIILDDASTDNTIEVCEEVLGNFPHKIYKNNESLMMNLKEAEHKKKLWNLTIKEKPDWILLLDADELFEDWGITVLPQIVNDVSFDVYYFRMYHMWEDEEHYRDDGLWKPIAFTPYLLRYQPNYEYKWEEKAIHCNRYPLNIRNMPGCYCYVKLKHYGHFTKEIRKAKYERYKLLDPNAEFTPQSHYDSILEENPVLGKL